MNTEINEDIINKVINEPVGGGYSTSYCVHWTAERVMLVFGLIPLSHREALESLIEKQTKDEWINDPEIAAMVGAKMAISLPALHKSFKVRLDSALSENKK